MGKSVNVGGGFLVVLLCFLDCLQVGLAQSSANAKRIAISWDDMKMDKRGARLVLFFCGGVKWTGHTIVARQRGEKVLVPRTKPYISMIGDQNRVCDTVISWNNKASDADSNGTVLGTYRSASVTIESDYFCATGITFENTVVAEPGGQGMQAVAMRVSSKKAFFYKVRVLGAQDTLLDESGTHYFYKCHIQGSIDFIFGRAKSLFQECVLQSTAKKSGAIAAHHRDSPNEDTGFSFVGCVIKGTGKILLGRAWGNYSRTIYSYCYLNDIIDPSGWSDWNYPYRQKTVVFGEYECSGRGTNAGGRVPWLKPLKYEDARPYLDIGFIGGEQWLIL
ncbi:hypothetical protein D5086_003199 [Populus alba]|uniref:Uncharacterized protein n=1 Tax=Populus alba TaxID=43335 RepID=A0ACC4D476_POPAL